jgi:hypothetical protein
MVTLIFILQAAITPCRKSTKSAHISPDPLCAAAFCAEKFGLPHGNTALSGRDLCTRTMFIICKLPGEPMKKLFACLTILFAIVFLSAAQTARASSNGQGGATDQATEKKSASKKGAGGATLTGCLSGPNDEGVYELKSGKKEVEVGGLDELSKHVGHQVRLHGSWAKSGSEIGEKESSESKSKEEKGERHFKVASIDHLKDSCPAGAAEKGEHKKGAGAGTPPKQ